MAIALILFPFLKVWIQSGNDTPCFSWLKQEYCKRIWWVGAAVNQSKALQPLSASSICINPLSRVFNIRLLLLNNNTLIITLVSRKKASPDAISSQVTTRSCSHIHPDLSDPWSRTSSFISNPQAITYIHWDGIILRF